MDFLCDFCLEGSMEAGFKKTEGWVTGGLG